MNALYRRLELRLSAPRDAASIAAFRVLFGALMAVSALRFMANGWVERFYVQRTFTFKFWGFAFVDPGPAWVMYGVYGTLAALGVAIALGWFYRVATPAFFVLFSYTELIDVTNYLNHYYLVSLLALLLCFVPAHAQGSLDALRNPALYRATLPAWMLYLLRFQVAVVYLGAALAKTGSDWLLHGQPLNVWLAAHTDVPLIGPYMVLPEMALLASWGGFLHDLLVVPLLLWARTRAWAYALLLAFHLATSTWFNIGIFPVLMPMAATLFFEPSWPRRLLARVRRAPREHIAPRSENDRYARGEIVSRWALSLIAAYCVVQVALPLRTHLYGGNVLWHEQGMRFSWRVMLRAKHGSVSFRVALPNGREVRVSPRTYLSSEQEREMAGQPDLILQLAHHIARDFAARGVRGVAVRADARVSLNGRKPVPMIDPRVDLTQVRDGLGLATWVTAAPEGAPLRLSPSSAYATISP